MRARAHRSVVPAEQQLDMFWLGDVNGWQQAEFARSPSASLNIGKSVTHRTKRQAGEISPGVGPSSADAATRVSVLHSFDPEELEPAADRPASRR